MYSIRTDLAIEAHEIYKEQAQQKEAETSGIKVETQKSDDVLVTRVSVLDKNGEQALGKPIGNYITIEAPNLKSRDVDLYETVSKIIMLEIEKLATLNEKSNVLVVGLGNWNITPDALGPKVVSSLLVTRHLIEYVPDQIDKRMRPLCAIAPGVLGLTGIETGEIIKGVVDKIKPDLIIAIDALASRKMDRVSTTIQIADTGIIPGSGVSNKRQGISYETLGTKVIAIGVPTVVDAATIAMDTIDKVIEKISANVASQELNKIKSMQENEKYDLIKNVLSPFDANLMVTPKEVDTIIEDISKIVANGINLTIHKGMEIDEISYYIG